MRESQFRLLCLTKSWRLVATALTLMVVATPIVNDNPIAAATVGLSPAPRAVHAVEVYGTPVITFTAPMTSGAAKVTYYEIRVSSQTRPPHRCYSDRCIVGGVKDGVPSRFSVAAVNRFGIGSYSALSNWLTLVKPDTATSTITYDANGGAGSMPTENEITGGTGPLATNTFTYAGYAFVGWNTAANGSGTEFSDGERVTFRGSDTLYAQWSPVTSTTTTLVSTIPASHYGPQGEIYQTYGNVFPTDLGDCTFAAAANWEQLLLNAQPDPTAIGYEFAEAGGTATGGLAMSQLFTYWRESGIAGYYLHGYTSFYTAQVDVENGVLDYEAMIAVLQFVNGDYIGNEQVTSGSHAVVVDGYTPVGPLVVSWGTTIQMSWEQWNAEVTAMYGINASSTAN